MGMEQETLIYVEENDKEEAKLLTKGLLNNEVRSRAFFNALGAELGLKYLALENISSDKTYNLHNVHKILEEFDISDIMLNNIHIDVRVVFDENQIFIPKSHFEYDILPDIYFVFLLSEDRSHVKFLGFFEPKLINKNNQNKDYYFIEKEKLTSPLNLKAYIEAFKGNTTQTLPENIKDTAETLMVSLVDQSASKEEIKELLQYLTKSSQLRDRFIEFENFEILSYKAERSPDVTVPEDVARENIIDATIDDIRPQQEAETTVEENSAVSDIDDNNTVESQTSGEEVSNLENAGSFIAGAAAAGTLVEAVTASDAAEGAVDAVVDTAANIAEEAVQDVTNMFTNASMTDMQEVMQESADLSLPEVPMEPLSGESDMLPASSVENSAEAADTEASANLTNTSVEDLPSLGESDADTSKGADNQQETIQEQTSEETSHDFVESNTDDFFADMNFDEPVFDEKQDETSEKSFDEGLQMINDVNDSSETVDFDAMPPSEISQQVEVSSGDEMEVLDISDVNAVPNNLDQNISETVEFNNIELSHEKPCFNELNGEETVPMLNMNDFTPLEPLPADNYNAESYDMDSLSITDNMIMPKLETAEETFEAVNMDDLNINSGMVPAKQQQKDSKAKEEEEALNALSSELDTIPDFDGEDMGLGDLEDTQEVSSGAAATVENPQAAPEQAISADDLSQTADAMPPLEDIEKLTVDDIVDQTSDEPAGDEPVTDLESLVHKDELENVEAKSEEIPTIEDALENPEIQNEELNETADNSSEGNELPQSEDVTAEENQSAVEDDNKNGSDIGMLFNETSDDATSEIQDFGNFDEDLEQIPSIYKNTQKLPVKMFAIAAVAAVLVVGGIAGFSLKNKNASVDSEPLAQEVPEQLPVAENSTSSEPAVANNENVQGPIADNTDILANNTPEVQTIPAPQKEPVNVKKESPKDVKKPESSAKPAATPVSYTGVSKLSWEVPDYLSYSDNIKKYLQTAGKSIKLTLSSDLLLVNEYAYSNQMKVDLKLSSDGNLKASNVVKSSGSSQIDKIVLQTVKDTLNVIKPATGEVPTPDFRLALIINF